MDDVKPESVKGPTYSMSPNRTMNNVATCNRLLNGPSGPRPDCQRSSPSVLKLNNSDSQDIRGRMRGSQNGPRASGHAPAIHSIRNLYPENFAPSFPHGSPGSGRSEGGRSSRVSPAAAGYHSRAAKAKPPKQQGAGDAEEEEE